MMEPGVINVYKEQGLTSHDVVAAVRRLLAGAKVGHTGTLDPAAEGVLPVCVGRATKAADLLTAGDKAYRAQVRLGLITDTGDETGQVLARRDVNVTLPEIEQAVSSFLGESLQTPPMYSAIKHQGRKLYELARAGVTVAREPRRIRIDRLKILDINPAWFTLEVECSKGTYIRSLCADIGEKLGCGACMGSLTRTRSGSFLLESAVKLGALKDAAAQGRLTDYVIPIVDALPFKRLSLSPEALTDALNGHPVPVSALQPGGGEKILPNERYWLMGGGRLVGLYRAQPEALRMEILMAV